MSRDPNSLRLQAIASETASLRRDLHANPEIAFEEVRTSAVVAQVLRDAGIEVHTGIGRTGVVGVLRRNEGNGGSGCIALRADMDALPVPEGNTFAHRSRNEGKMHACGHDGHTAMLLGAARWLKAHGRFAGTVCFVFQPAEESHGGAAAMLADGLLDRFPIERFYGLHNWPGLPVGHFAVVDGPVMAAADEFEGVITGRGAHGAMPHLGSDPVVAGAALVQALQTVVARNLDPLDPAVISVTRFHAGHANNVIPGQATLGGTVRSFHPAVRDQLEEAMQRICAGISTSHGVTATLRYTRGYPATFNDAREATRCRAAAQAIGATLVDAARPSMGAEDFSMFGQERPACYVWLGNGPGEGGCTLHSPHYDFNDALIETGIRYWSTLVESALPMAS
jgi:amidohydrolase